VRVASGGAGPSGDSDKKSTMEQMKSNHPDHAILEAFGNSQNLNHQANRNCQIVRKLTVEVEKQNNYPKINAISKVKYS
jgi:hypothetical protein